MAYTMLDVVEAVGENLLKNEGIQKGIKTTLKGTAGLGAIGVGTALETVGAGTIVGTAGSAITGAGCVATQALMTGATAVLPTTIGTAVSGALGTAAMTVAAVASSPLFLGGVIAGGTIYGVRKFVKWCNE